MKERCGNKNKGNIILQALFSCLAALGLVSAGLSISYYYDLPVDRHRLPASTSMNGQIRDNFIFNKIEKNDALIILGKEDEKIIKKEKASFSSENFQIKQISLGDEVIVSGDIPQENFLVISDIRGEAYISEQNKKNFKILVTWKTNQPSKFKVEYYPISNKQDKKTLKDSTYSMNHAAVIDNLNSGESYVYQIHCSDRWGKEISSNPRSILSSSEPVLITDLINKAFKDIFGWAMKKN